jgi:AmmeMemoRadiSam system protein B
MTDPDPDARGVLGPSIAGTWYPSAPAVLAGQLDEMFASAPKVDAPPGNLAPKAVIVPHAGLVYSGPVAAGGFRAIAARPAKRAVVIGPSHFAEFRGLRLPAAASYRTPLGNLPIDADAVRALCEWPRVAVDPRPFEREHCLEIELPFLQRSFGDDLTIVPMLVGASSTSEDRTLIARALESLFDTTTTIVVSSDFTHYGSAFRYVPFRTEVSAKIRDLDMGAIDRIVACDRPGFEEYVAETGATICGRSAIDVLLAVLPSRAQARLVSYDTSGHITGDWTHSVSYASIAFWW